MAFGPRIPNTPGHDKMGDWLAAQLRQRADTVIVQAFTQRTSKGVTLRLRNFFARFRPEATDRVLFLAHWDTRPKADKSANLGQQQLPVPGANDGASGVAVLLGIADALKARAPTIGSTSSLWTGRTSAISTTRPRRCSARGTSLSTCRPGTRRCLPCCSTWWETRTCSSF